MYENDEEELSFSEKVLFTYTGTAGTVCIIVVLLYIFRWLSS